MKDRIIEFSFDNHSIEGGKNQKKKILRIKLIVNKKR